MASVSSMNISMNITGCTATFELNIIRLTTRVMFEFKVVLMTVFRSETVVALVTTRCDIVLLAVLTVPSRVSLSDCLLTEVITRPVIVMVVVSRSSIATRTTMVRAPRSMPFRSVVIRCIRPVIVLGTILLTRQVTESGHVA